MDLVLLTTIQALYEKAFGADLARKSWQKEEMSTQDLIFSQIVFAASSGSRFFQIKVEDEAVPCAFLKPAGINFENMLLQIIVSKDKLKLEDSRLLFFEWIVDFAKVEKVRELASQFEDTDN